MPASNERGDVPEAPSKAVLDFLLDAVSASARSDSLRGGGRDFRREELHDEATRWLGQVQAAMPKPRCSVCEQVRTPLRDGPGGPMCMTCWTEFNTWRRGKQNG